MTNINKDYKVQIDREVYTVQERCLTGAQLLKLAGKEPVDQFLLFQKLKGGKVDKVEYDQTVCLDDPGIERFTTQKKSHQDGSAVKYKIQVDRDTIDAPSRCMTGAQILELVGKQPYTDFQLYQKLKSNKVVKVEYEETVCFDDPGIERFTTQKKSHQDGEARKRDFDLLEDDSTALDAHQQVWDSVKDTNLNYVILRGVKLPDGYNVEFADVAIRIDGGYPRTQLDMAFFHPALNRTDGRPIAALTPLSIEGKTYQQWSRHRTEDNPWREGIDCLVTHLGFAMQWLEDEFKKTPRGVSA
ncbi:multiubiquitin domain-containing protein [Chryseolinea soli]|uniref:Multi-ubiquitin domain-containing protein n=1 Tax=Chryseolinea soli TaxID=2321403 RepID=A0A385SYS6_9BACT|nr:multiubiquitin domain-containing protein [Chryseolinea soli]AYB34920.1 hypothetical protein D4L85_31990 [Chryseolinea soli]